MTGTEEGVPILKGMQTLMMPDVIFHVSPAFSIEHDIDDSCSYIIVSSGDRYDHLNDRSNVCVLHFADTEVRLHPDAIKEEDVEVMVGFICKSRNRHVHVCCDEGRSRSPAIAAGLLKCLGRDDAYIWKSVEECYRPNKLVYETILRYAPEYFRNNMAGHEEDAGPA